MPASFKDTFNILCSKVDIASKNIKLTVDNAELKKRVDDLEKLVASLHTRLDSVQRSMDYLTTYLRDAIERDPRSMRRGSYEEEMIRRDQERGRRDRYSDMYMGFDFAAAEELTKVLKKI